jgi:hypothetical protein
MEEVIGTFDDASLKQGKVGNGLLVSIIQIPDVGDDHVQPSVFVVSEIDVVKGVLDEGGVMKVFVSGEQGGNIFFRQCGCVILDECQTDEVVEPEYVVVRNLLTLALEKMAHTTRSPKSIQGGVKWQVLDVHPNPVEQF